MAHHGGPDDTIQRMMRELDLGATGHYPLGKLTAEDEGEMRIGITATQGKVVLAFGKDVSWIGFDADQARQIAGTLLSKADECDGRRSVIRFVGE